MTFLNMEFFISSFSLYEFAICHMVLPIISSFAEKVKRNLNILAVIIQWLYFTVSSAIISTTIEYFGAKGA